ncbi:MAG: methyltransferase domain-containing protein [Deltaproteobacteria bacterium]|nr:methyltransferase domain-containing protein [Deltaproteobacteria bacterium]
MAAPVVSQSWAQFDPADYLNEYYGDIGSENLALLRFLAETSQDSPEGGRLLDFGGGPTIYTLISAAARVDEIHFADYLDANLDEVRRWIHGDPAAFDWSNFIRQALELESGLPATQAQIEARAKQIRERVTRLAPCDASRMPPSECPDGLYDVLQTHFCAESATSDRWQWQAYMSNIISLLKPGGRLVMSALRWFPAVAIFEDDLIELLEENGFPRKTIEVRCVPADRPTRDYKGLMLAVAQKGPDEAEGGC